MELFILIISAWIITGLLTWLIINIVEPHNLEVEVSLILIGLLICCLIGPVATIMILKSYSDDKKKEKEELKRKTPWYLLKKFGGDV